MTPLHSFGRLVRSLVESIPIVAIRSAILLVLAGMLVWILTLPRAETCESAAGGRKHDLRWGAAAAIIIQIAIYALL